MDKKAYQSKLKTYLETNWKAPDRRCPICLNNTWLAAEGMGMMNKYTGPALQIGGPYYPFIPIICKTCGYTFLLNAKIVGLTAPDEGGEPAQPLLSDQHPATAEGDDQ